MQYYYTYILVLLLIHQYLAQDEIDRVNDKNSKTIVEELFKKINDISEHSFSNMPNGKRLEMLGNVEGKLKKATKYLGKKGERYVKLIMKGIKAKALNENDKTLNEIRTNVDDNNFKENIKILIENPTTKTVNDSYGSNEIKHYLEKAPVKIDMTNVNETDKDIKENVHFVLNDLRRMNIISNGSNEKYSLEKTRETSTDRLVPVVTPTYECEGSLDKICLSIRDMKLLKCLFDDSVVPIEKLCDGLTDCTDATDEKFCTSQVTERINNANQVIHQTDLYLQLGCFVNKSPDSIMSSQIVVMRSVLHAQQEFVEKYKYFNRSMMSNSEPYESRGGTANVRGAINEISLIISSLALALDAELCTQQVTIENGFGRKFNDQLFEDYEKVMDDVDWLPKSCVCKGESCKNIATCRSECKRVCWQKYALSRWRCPSINETENVPLSVICDGKFDCFDESDERDCFTGNSFGKYEAHKMFEEILSSLSVKAISKEYEFLRNMFLSLHNTIEDLQRFSMASVLDLKMIRTLRNKCFSALSTIYSETLTKSSFLYLKNEVYIYLLSLNENIVNALKLSHTGNKRIISNDGCYCREGRCTMSICSRNCVRSCVAEPWLTRYFCKNSVNKSVSMDDICNGKSDCPEEDDEAHCEKEICQRHHLTSLRHSFQTIGKRQEGTSVGELLTSWKTKVTSTLLVTETNVRPNSNVIRDVVRDILNDLVMTYGAVKDYRKNNEYALDDFISIARNIMKFVKSCGF